MSSESASSYLTYFGSRRSARGFTLIEMLIVIGIIAILLGLLGVVATKARAKARLAETKSLVSRIHSALDIYKSEHGEYPSPSAGGYPERVPDLPPSDATFLEGVELEVTWLTERSPGAKFNKKDLDPNDGNYFWDSFGNRIRYRKYSINRMLVWSIGKDGVNDIGTSSKESMGDDIDMRKMDY